MTAVDAHDRTDTVRADRLDRRVLLRTTEAVRVEEAYDNVRNARVVLKSVARTSDAAVALRNEFALISRIQHASIVRAHEIVTDGERVTLVMECVEGTRIDEWIDVLGKRAHPAARARAVERAFARLASAIATLHDNDLLHLDIHPGNVLIDASDLPKLIDFGQAIDLQHALPVQGGGVAGYAAPELSRSGAPSAAADWYSFGWLYRQMLMRAHGAAEPADTGANPGLGAVMQELLQARPEDRPRQTEILQALDARPFYRRRMAFIGRRRELAELSFALDHAVRDAKPVVCCIAGGAGIGKTRLVGQFLAAHRQNTLHFRVTCRLGGGSSDTIFDGLAAAVAATLSARDLRDLAASWPEATYRVLPALEPLRPESLLVNVNSMPTAFDRSIAQMALLELLGALSGLTPVVVWLDDIQWAPDEAVAELLRALRRLRRGKLLIVATTRSHEGYGLLEGPRARLIRVDALDEASLDTIEGAAEREQIALALRVTGGIPYLAELALGGVEPRQLLAQLPARQQKLMALLALGRAQPLDVYRRASGLGEEFDAVALGLVDMRLATLHGGVRQNDGETEFEISHQLIADVATLAFANERDRLHESLRDALLAHRPIRWSAAFDHHRRSRVDGLARHDGRPRDRDVLAWAAARQAAALGHHAAESEALGDLLAATHPRTRFRLHLSRRRYARALSRSGRGIDAAAAFLKAAELAPTPEWSAHDSADAATCLLRLGRLDEGIDLLHELVGDESGFTDAASQFPERIIAALQRLTSCELPDADPEPANAGSARPTRASMLLCAARGLLACDMARGAYFATQALVQALDANEHDVAAEAAALVVAGVLPTIPGAAFDALSARLRAFVDRTALRSRHQGLTALLGYADGQRALLKGDYGRALERLEAAAQALDPRRSEETSWERNAIHTCLLRCLEEAGRLEDLRRIAGEHEEFALRTNDLWGQLLARGYLAVYNLLAADEQTAETYLDLNAVPGASKHFVMQVAYDLRSRAIAAMLKADLTAAQEAATTMQTMAEQHMLLTNPLIRFDLRILHARIATLAYLEHPRADNRAAVEHAITVLTNSAAKAGYAPGTAVGLCIAAALAKADALADISAAHCAAAADTFRANGMFLSALLCDTGVASLSDGSANNAQGMLQDLEAMGVAEPLKYARANLPGVL